MSTLDSPTQQGVSAEVEPTFRAVRVNTRPYDYQSFSSGGLTRTLGHFRLVATTSALAFAANAIVAAFRWTDSTSLAVITRVILGVSDVTAVTAQRVDPVVLTVARGYTARDATAATSVTPTGNSCKLRSSMSPSAVGNIDVANAAAGLSGGTRTNDSAPIGFADINGIAGLGTAVISPAPLFTCEINGEHPLVLAANEGILVSWGATAVATGTAELTVQFDWAEVATF